MGKMMDRMHARAISRRTLLALGSVAVPAALTACTLPGQGNSSTAANGEDTLRISVGQLDSIDPCRARTGAALQVVSQVFDPLMAFDMETFRPALKAALIQQTSDDARTFTFRLRHASFHDGTTVTSADFKRAWGRLVAAGADGSGEQDGAVATDVAPSYLLSLVEGYDDVRSGAAKELSGISCPDDITFIVRLSQPYADFPAICTHPALAPIPQLATDDEKTFIQKPVGNGPYQLARAWKSDGDVVLDSFEDYYGVPGSVEHVRLRPRVSTNDAFRDLTARSLDVAQVPVGQVPATRRDIGAPDDGYTAVDGGRFLDGTTLYSYFLVVNTGRDPLSSLSFRRALSRAIDREGLCSTVFNGLREPAYNILPPALCEGEPEAWLATDLDVDAASEVLGEFAPASGDGISLGILCSEDGAHQKVAAYLQTALKAVGVTVEIDTVPAGKYQDKLEAGAFDLALMGWTPDYPARDAVLYPLFASGSPHNYAGYADEDIDAALTAARQTVDDDERARAFDDICRRVGEALPVIPLGYGVLGLAVSSSIEYISADPRGVVSAASAEFSK